MQKSCLNYYFPLPRSFLKNHEKHISSLKNGHNKLKWSQQLQAAFFWQNKNSIFLAIFNNKIFNLWPQVHLIFCKDYLIIVPYVIQFKVIFWILEWILYYHTLNFACIIWYEVHESCKLIIIDKWLIIDYLFILTIHIYICINLQLRYI